MMLNNFLTEAKKILKPLFGVLSSQILVMIINTIDLIYAGKISSLSLAGLAVAYGSFVPVVLLLAGFVRISPLISNNYGKHSESEIANLMRHNIISTAVCGLIGGLLVYFVMYRLGIVFGVSAEILEVSKQYLKIIAIGMPAFLFYFSFRSIFEGFLRTEHILYGAMVAIAVDLSLNWLNHNYLHLGLQGVGLAHIMAYYFWVVSFFISYKFSNLCRYKIFDFRGFKFDFAELKKIYHYSFYVGLGSLVESLFFTSTSLMVARFGVVMMASYKLVLNTATIMVMIPGTLGVVMSSIIGYRLGAGQQNEILKNILVGFGIFILFFIAGVISFTNFEYEIMSFYSNDAEVISMAITLLGLMLVNFLFQSIDTLTSAIIKGFNRTYYIGITVFCCYFLVGLPLIYILSSTDVIVPAMGIRGVFLGMITAYGIGTLVFGYLAYRSYKLEVR